MEDTSIYSLSQPTPFAFSEDIDMFHQEDLNLLSGGWNEGQMIPGVSNFLGMGGEWLANGAEDIQGMTAFTGLEG